MKIYWIQFLQDFVLGSKKIIVALILFTLFGFKKDKQEGVWELKKMESGIAVYTRLAENSKFKELKSVFQVKTSLSSFVALLTDFESYPQWVYRCGKSKTIKKISAQEFMHYQTVMAPWPVDNRDVVIQIKLAQDPITKVVTQKASAIADSLPALDSHVRIKTFNAQWTLTPNKNGILDVEYHLMVDPGGNIPAWLVNLAVIDGPFDTELKMKEWLFKEKYQKSKISFIKELE